MIVEVTEILDDKDWLILRTIDQERNITKAAELLYISQPSLTYRIQQMEKEFGTSILIRRKKGVDFTPEGEYLVQYANKMLKELREAKDYINNLRTEIKGTLRLGVSRTYARYRLPAILSMFLEDYKNVEIKLKSGFSSEVVQMLQKEEATAGIVRDLSSWNGSKLLIDEEDIVVVSKHEIMIDDLPKLPRIDYMTDPSLQSAVDHWWKETFSIQPKLSMEVDMLDTCLEMVNNGLGYAILPSICLKEHHQLNTYELWLKKKKLKRQTWLIYHSYSLELKVVKAFVKFLKRDYGTPL